jgi:hypothetical protein
MMWCGSMRLSTLSMRPFVFSRAQPLMTSTERGSPKSSARASARK